MARQPEDVDAFVPLKALDYYILLVLVDGECHGYRMVKEIRRQSAEQIQPLPGNLYRSIRRLMDCGLVAESDRRPAPESDDERRRYYGLTELGTRVLAAETARMRAAVEAAEGRVAIGGREVLS